MLLLISLQKSTQHGEKWQEHDTESSLLPCRMRIQQNVRCQVIGSLRVSTPKEFLPNFGQVHAVVHSQAILHQYALCDELGLRCVQTTGTVSHLTDARHVHVRAVGHVDILYQFGITGAIVAELYVVVKQGNRRVEASAANDQVHVQQLTTVAVFHL